MVEEVERECRKGWLEFRMEYPDRHAAGQLYCCKKGDVVFLSLHHPLNLLCIIMQVFSSYSSFIFDSAIHTEYFVQHVHYYKA